MPVDLPTEYREFYSAEEAEQWGKIHFPELRCNSPDYETLFLYAGSGYCFYNPALRGVDVADEESASEILRITDILGRHTLPESVVAYRYTHKQDLKLLLQGERLRLGLRFADKAFFSASLVKSSLDEFQKQYNCNCLLKLYLPKGIHGVYISLNGTDSCLNEQELLLQRDTKFEIIKIHRFCCPMVIECKAIIDPTSEA